MIMEIKLEVLASTCIKQNKPWPRITWLGQEKEAVYLLDEKNINEINLFSGKTKKKIPQLCHLLKNVILLTTSRNGAWLAGILKIGELFLWNKDQDTIKMVPLADEVKKVVMATQEYSRRFYLYVSGDGNKALVTTPTVCVFLWENMECQSSPSKNPVVGQWSQIIPEASILLPSVEEKETAVSADFIKTEMLGDICLCSFAFCSEENLMLIFLEIKWQENALTNARIHWAQQRCCLTGLAPQCEPVKSRGALLTAFSHDGLALAIAVNQKDLQTSQILFMNTTNFVTVSGSLKGCGAKNHKISSKLVRSYWIADMTWTTDSLFLACMLKRGSLILMTCLGELLTLVTFGCSVEFGPAEFIPLHPLIMYRSQNSLLQDLNHCHDSSASEGDLMRQRFSITSHPSLPYLITSDGYIVTVLRFSDGFSPSAYMRSLLLDSAQRLEKLRHNLITSKSKEKRLPLQPLSSLRANLLQQHQNQNCSFSTIPKFLQEEKRASEVNGESTCVQDYSDDSDDDKMFQSRSFIWGSPKAAVSSCDEGRLEFASMFDTIHAVDCPGEKDDTSLELNCIQKNLIAAWRVGISSSIQERDKLLSYTIRCITHFFNILQFTKLNFVHLNNAFRNRPWMQCVLKCFQQFLTVLSWESKHRHTLGHLMKLTLQTLKLMLAEQQDDMFSSSLLGGFSLLKIVSHYLNCKNIPQYATFSTLLNINNVELDSITTPLFRSVDCNSHQNFCALDSIQKASPATVNLTKNSENRLIVMWRLLYKHVLWYWAELNKKAQNSSKAIKEKLLANEGPITGALATHIQAVLQSSGEKLEQTFSLNSVSGEERFLVGSYKESMEAWERALQEAKAEGGKRMPFLQTRYYLAMLYCHLYHYGLTEAQGLCDRLVSELLRRTQISVRDRNDESEAEWMTNNVSTEAALAVVQCLARFMAAYFTNQPLYVLPPHRVDILPPLHIRPDRCSRVIPLEHSIVTDAVRNQGLSGVWTVEYALDLLLVGGLIPEAVWLTHKLGDWKMAVSVGVAFNLYCQSNNRFSRSETVELCLPPHLTPTQIFQEKLQSFLGQAVNNGTSNQGDKSRYKQLTDPVEEESACVLFNSVEEILKAAVIAEADIVSETFLLLVDFAKELSRKLNGLVPDTLYLPAPPLYCPQPALPNEEEHTDLSLTMERNCRQKVSRVIQRILLLFRAAHCSLPAAQWYIVQLKRTRKIMQKIRKKVALPSLSALPENLLNYSKYGSVFSKPTSSGDHKLDDVSCKTIASFRDLCALCWMLHVREMLSDSCRRYQTAREKMENQKECQRTEFDACIVECSLTALEWASRMLPFAHFMNIEELVQDIILSLIGELPPIKKVAEILVKAFPNPEDVRVSLRDKYSALQRRLQHCIVKGPSSEEMMSVVLQAVHKVNVKTLKCVIRNIGPYEKNIWEPPEEETQDPGACCYDKLSLGTSLSRSTISDLGNSQIYSDAETAESLSEALLVEETKKHILTQMQENNKEIHHEELIRCNKTAEKLEDFSVKERRNKKENTKDITNQHVLPLVGEWEFERDDDEYIKFLDLFLTYILERDLIDHRHSVIPFLVNFSPLLREHELNSLLFDVHTTLKRRQIRNNGQNVFRAGSCYTTVFEPSASELVLLRDKKKKESKDRTPPVTIQQAIEPSESAMGLRARRGLFGVSRQSSYSTHDGSNKNISLTSVLTQHSSEQASSVPQKVPNHICIYKVIQTNEVTKREDPTPEMKFKFNNVARLLEWMIRWSDKRLLYDPISRQPFQECQPIMHVKISASAILASLWLLEYYSNKPGDQDICFSKLHDGSASVCSPTLGSKIEDSSMDTGCSPSAGISVGIPDSHVWGKPSENAPGILQEKQPEKKETDLKGHSVTHDRMIGGTDCDVGLKEEMGEFTPSKVEVTSENEDYCEDPFAVSRSPTISVSIKSVQQKKEHQSLADVQCPQEDVFVKKLEGNATKLESTPCGAIPSDVPCSVCPEMKTESTSKEITVSDNQPSFTVVSSALSSDPSGPKNEEMDAREPTSQPTAQPLNISDAVREMLQDEMFKLVQLQQINFMSLMQVVGASFANLPNISQQMQQSQPFQLERSQTPNIAGTDVTRSPPRHPADGFLKAQMASLESSCHVRSKNINPQGKDNLLDQQSHNGYVLNPPQTNDSSGLSENQSNGKNQIPPFQSLLHQIPARPLPLLSAYLKDEKKPKLIPLAKPLNNADGLPLLKLKPQCEFQLLNVCPVTTPPRSFIGPQPQRKECWGAQASFVKHPQGETTAHLNLNNYDHRAIKQTQEQTSNQVEILSKETSKQDHLDRYGKTEDISLHHFQAHLRGEKSLADNETLLQKTYEHFTQFPLLYLKPWSQSKRPSELITVKCTGKDKDFREPCGQTALPLLYANLSPPVKFQTPKLIPLQNLIVFEQSRHIAQAPQTDHPEQIQLLKADIKSLEARQDRNSKKRQKRRTERRIREKKEREKTAVTFQQDDFVDLTDTVKQTKDNRVEFNYDFSDGGSLLNQDAVNVAGLHYLASVRKGVAELQDASTNTETVLTSHQDIQTLSEEIIYETGINQPLLSASASATGFKSHQDIQGVSEEINSEPSKNELVASPSASEKEPLPSGVPQTLPPDLYWNLTFPTEAAEKPLPSSSSDVASDLIGQKYISVIDIESGGDLKNLPDISESPPKCIPTQAVKTELPTFAKLHHMAASVTNVISPEEFEKQGNAFQTESRQVLPETGEAEIAHDPLTLCLLRKDFSINSSTELSAKKISKERLSAKLQEMDRQLLTLQNVADRMEKEFHNTKLLVETIEDIGVIADPEKDDMSFLAPGVKVIKEERYSIHGIMENSAEGGSLESESFQAIYIDSRTPSVSPSVSAATLRIKKSSSDINFRTEEFDESFSDHLQMTGLSGVSDIITDLIAEGGISASELGLTENQATNISSFSGEVNSRKTKRDKKELQTWMKRKRKERLAEYMQTLAERRAREHSPFPLRKNMHLALSTRDFKMQQEKKEEKDKALFSEHHNHRVSEALVLMHELLSDTVQLPSNDDKQMPKIISPHDFKRPHIASTRSYHGSCQATRKMVAAKAGFSQTKSFSSLSSDVTQRRGQICQAPYRRMASEARSQKQWSSSKLDLQSQASHQTRKSVNQRRLPTAETATQASEESDDGAMSSWSVPDEIQQILYGSSNFNKETSQEDGCSIASLNHFDSASESTSSILSKLDWNAVEAMVANVEEK